MIDVSETQRQPRTDDNSARALLTICDADGWAIRLVGGDRPGPVDPEADPVSAPLPAGVSHLLAADDALQPGRWGSHVAVCGPEVRGPNATGTEHTCDPSCDCNVRYCLECVLEAVRWVAEAGQTDRASGNAR